MVHTTTHTLSLHRIVERKDLGTSLHIVVCRSTKLEEGPFVNCFTVCVTRTGPFGMYMYTGTLRIVPYSRLQYSYV